MLIERLITYLVTFISAFTFFYGIASIFVNRKKQKENVGKGEYTEELSPIFQIVRPLARRLIPFNKKLNLTAYEASLKRKLLMAGRPGNLTPLEFIGFKEIFAIFFCIIGFMLGIALKKYLLTLTLLGFLFGFYFPSLDLRSTIYKRQLAIIRALPFDLDLLTLSVEAGLDFATATQKVVEKGKKSPLTDEWTLMLKEIRMGKTRKEALKAMADRCNIPDLNTFVTSLILADQMGAGLGNVLRIQSEQLRRKRTQRAEELAQKAPVKMLGPLIGCIFPAVFIILFAPIIVQWFIIGFR